MDALIAYLQMLGTLVDFKLYDNRPTSAEEAPWKPIPRFAAFAQTWGLVYFVAMFLAVVVYALWPKNRKRFDDAARIPLRGGLSHGHRTQGNRRRHRHRTTGHEWDGIKELNKPLPRWWL